MNYEKYLYACLDRAADRFQIKEGQEDVTDSVSLDIPLLIRLFEYMREDVKTDADLHVVVEKIIALRSVGVLTMAEYPEIVASNPTDPQSQTALNLESIKKLAGL